MLGICLMTVYLGGGRQMVALSAGWLVVAFDAWDTKKTAIARVADQC
jgi:hypothetical protein